MRHALIDEALTDVVVDRRVGRRTLGQLRFLVTACGIRPVADAAVKG